MSVTFNSSVVISKFWADFKTLIIDSKSLSIQYDIDIDTDNQKYIIFALDDNIAYVCYIWLNLISPDFVLQYSQSQNDIDRDDFINNYLSIANTRLSSRTDSTKMLYDLTDSSIIYIGTAHVGDLTSDAVWFIKKISLDVNGNPISILHTNYMAIWDNRTNETYN